MYSTVQVWESSNKPESPLWRSGASPVSRIAAGARLLQTASVRGLHVWVLDLDVLSFCLPRQVSDSAYCAGLYCGWGLQVVVSRVWWPLRKEMNVGANHRN